MALHSAIICKTTYIYFTKSWVNTAKNEL